LIALNPGKMKNSFSIALVGLVILLAATLFNPKSSKAHCLTGAFLADAPSAKDINNFRNEFGKSPYLVMVFVDWDNYVPDNVVSDVYSQGSVLFITWEPWKAADRSGIDYDSLLNGGYDKYISDFSLQLKAVGKPVFLRFGHEMNGDWYPWSALKLGKEKYISIYRHVKDIFGRNNVNNVKWVFSVNWEDVPKDKNSFICYYPGDAYVDYVGIDGYNWGTNKPWSKWMGFYEIFGKRYAEIQNDIHKPVLITEFSSTSEGGNKGEWIRKALQSIKKMPNVQGFILFNVNKETDWGFLGTDESAKILKKQLKDPYFIDRRLHD